MTKSSSSIFIGISVTAIIVLSLYAVISSTPITKAQTQTTTVPVVQNKTVDNAKQVIISNGTATVSINVNGATGTPGPIGPAGPQGPPGANGTSSICIISNVTQPQKCEPLVNTPVPIVNGTVPVETNSTNNTNSTSEPTTPV